MTTQRSADIVTGAFLALVGAVVIVAALDLKSTFGERLAPSHPPGDPGLHYPHRRGTAEPKSLLVPRRGTICGMARQRGLVPLACDLCVSDSLSRTD